MKRKILPAVLILLLSFSSVAGLCLIKKGRAETTLVVPDDYATIQDAINAAAEGNTIIVRKGLYEAPENQSLTIDKTISLVGDGASNTKVNLHPSFNITTIITQTFVDYADPIAIEADSVKISGFTITSDGGEISLAGNRIQIIDSIISTGLSISGSYNTIAGNSVLKPIILENANSNTISNNTLVSLTLGYDYHPCADNVISGNRIEGPGSFGIYILGSSRNIFYANRLANFQGSGSKYSGYGVVFASTSMSENNTFYHNTFINNTGTVAVNDGDFTTDNVWDNGEEGNYWDDYNGTDSNRDGIGDTPYVIGNGNVDNYPLMAPYDMENDTIVLPPPEPFPTAIVIAIAVAVACIGLLIYLKKHKP